MASIDAYIYIIIGLLGVAYPILLQVISRLDEKYTSENIIELFDNEYEGKIFRYSLITSLISIMIWSVKIKPIIQIDRLNFIINNSAAIIVAINTIILVISFFFFVRRILIYYTPTKFIKYLKTKHNIVENDFRYFVALSDILLLSIKRQQRNITLTLSDFFYSAFEKERKKHNNKPVEFPDVYYEIVHKSIEELAILKEKRNYSLEYRTAGGIWLLGELQGSEISDKTYAWLWRNILLAIQYKQDDMIVYHWETSHQYFIYSLPYIHDNYDSISGDFQSSNKEVVEKRTSERAKFIEFHDALGGLLTYKQRYNCIKRIFNHTNSNPPTYELLPESMDEIFIFYFSLINPYNRKYAWISQQYSFPQQSGLNADGTIKKWISSYMAILFLRQYTIVPYLTTMHPLTHPLTFKLTQGEIKEWINGLDFFKTLVSDHLNNDELMDNLNLKFITPQWCLKKNKEYPLDFIDTFKENLEFAYKTNALTLQISQEKVKQFENSTKSIIENKIINIQRVSNENNFDVDSDKWTVNGHQIIHSKDAFSKTPEVHHCNFDSFLASTISENLHETLALSFSLKKTKYYLLKPEDIFKAIDKLNINEHYIIVTFGVNIDYLCNFINNGCLTKEKYKNTNIYSFKGTRSANSSLFIIKKSNLPYIYTKEISQDKINKYLLNKISTTIHLHTSVIDLNNTTDEIFQEIRQTNNEEELRLSVLLSVIISTEIKWKKELELIQFVQYSEYRQKGLPNKLDEIEPFKKQLFTPI